MIPRWTFASGLMDGRVSVPRGWAVGPASGGGLMGGRVSGPRGWVGGSASGGGTQGGPRPSDDHGMYQCKR